MKLAKSFKIGAEILLGATILVLIYISAKEITAGNRTGIGLFVPIGVFTIFMWLGWTRPRETGLALSLLGIVIVLLFGSGTLDPFAWIMLGISTLITGLLLLGAGWKFSQTDKKQPPN